MFPAVEPGRKKRVRRARSVVPGVRAERVPPAAAGERVFRVVPDNAFLRRWGRSHGHRVSGYGKIPAAVRESFDRQNSWTVRIISLLKSGDTEPRQYYQVMQGPYIRKLTVDPFYVKRELGDDLFSMLKEVP